MKPGYSPCADCCECPAPTIQWDSRSASKSKCEGWPENPGFESIPPKFYSIKTETYWGEWRFASSAFGANSWSPSSNFPLYAWGGGCPGGITEIVTNSIEDVGSGVSQEKILTYDKGNCSLTVDTIPEVTPRSEVTQRQIVNACPGGGEISDSSFVFLSDDEIMTGFDANDPLTPTATFSGVDWTKLNDINSFAHGGFGIAGTPTNLGCSWPGCGDPTTDLRVYFALKYEIQLSDEYTTAQLITNTLAALPAWDDDWNDTAGSYRNLTTDELTYSVRESRYRFTFPVPKVGFGTCYKITWTEVFTPDVGDPVETERCAIWNGDLLESGVGIVGDGTNPYFELPIPETNGTVTVANIVAVCRGCADGCPE